MSSLSYSSSSNNYKNNIELNVNDIDLIKISNTELLVLEYIESLNEDERKAMMIAKSHLETSFCIEKSNGFINWKKKHKK